MSPNARKASRDGLGRRNLAGAMGRKDLADGFCHGKALAILGPLYNEFEFLWRQPGLCLIAGKLAPCLEKRCHHAYLLLLNELSFCDNIDEYRDAATLLADFWAEVDAVLKEQGVLP